MTKLFPIFDCRDVSSQSNNQLKNELPNNIKYNSNDGRKSAKRKAPGFIRKNNDTITDEIILIEDSFDEILFEDCSDIVINKISRTECTKKKFSGEILNVNEILDKNSQSISEVKINDQNTVTNKNKIYMKEMDYAPYSKLYHVPKNNFYQIISPRCKFLFSKKTKIIRKNVILEEEIFTNSRNSVDNSFQVGHYPTPEENSRIYHISMNNLMQSWYRYGAEKKDIGHLNYNLLSSALKPDCIQDFINNFNKIFKLKKWMESWKNKIINPSFTNKNKNENDGNDSDSSQDSIDFMETPFNPLIITGPSGVGKTSSIKFIANELGFNIISLGCDEKRNSTTLHTKLAGAISNFGVKSSKETLQNFFQPILAQEKAKKQKLGLTCIVIEDVDVVFDDDDGFWLTIKNFCSDSKVPIILTCIQEKDPLKELSKFSSFHYRKSVLQFDHISNNVLTDLIQSLILGSYKFYLNRIYLKYLIKEKKMDIRAILNHLHFILSTGLQPMFSNHLDFISEDIFWFKKSYLMNGILDVTSSNIIGYLPDFSEEYNKEVYQSYCESTMDSSENNAGELFNYIECTDIIDNLKYIRFGDNSSKTELASDIIYALKTIDKVFDSKTIRSKKQNRRHPFTRLGEMTKYPLIANTLRLKLKYLSF